LIEVEYIFDLCWMKFFDRESPLSLCTLSTFMVLLVSGQGESGQGKSGRENQGRENRAGRIWQGESGQGESGRENQPAYSSHIKNATFGNYLFLEI
jgi:hypothetical protein